MSTSVDRASASRAIARSTSPSVSTSAAPAQQLRRPCAPPPPTAPAAGAAGARGTTVAASSATAPPTRASGQRVNPGPGRGAGSTTTIDWTAAWVTKSRPASSRNAVDIDERHHHGELPGAGAEQQHEEVGDEHPDGHAQGHLGDPAQPLAVGGAQAQHRRDRGEERVGVTEQLRGDQPGQARRERALRDVPGVRPEPGVALTHRGTAAPEGAVERMAESTGTGCQTWAGFRRRYGGAATTRTPSAARRRTRSAARRPRCCAAGSQRRRGSSRAA